MKRYGLIGLAILVIASLTAPVFAWEFTMKGEAEYRYRYWTRTGNNDIFGNMNGPVANLGINQLQTFPSTAQTNRVSGTFGVMAGENRFGADMQLNDIRMTLFPVIKVNPAIELSASVNLTSLGIWSDGQPLISGAGAFNVPPSLRDPGFVNSLYLPDQDEAIGTNVPATYVTLQYLKMAIKTPMLDFSIGYKGTKLGMGLWKHEFNRPSASFDISTWYGPFHFGFAPYFGRNQSSWAVSNSGTGAPRSRNEGAGAAQRQTDRRNYFRALEGYIEYANGPLYVVIASDSYIQPDAPIPDKRGAAITTTAVPGTTTVRYRPTAAVKYFNGRYFFNAEIDWFTRWQSGRGAANATGTLVNQNLDNNAFLYGLESGFLCGPAKLTGNYVRATGDDPSNRNTTEDAASSEAGLNAGYMKDWGYLMYYMYGTGDGWDAAGYGQPTNFQHLGGRLDYAIASNLNLFAVYAYAWRDQPNAYTLGGDFKVGARPFTNDDLLAAQLAGQGAGTLHEVPDSAREIGWEIDLGFNWKLLENLTWDTTLAYWKPGTWWAYAYPNTAAIYNNNGPGFAPVTNTSEALATQQLGRDIDALFAVESRLLVTF